MAKPFVTSSRLRLSPSLESFLRTHTTHFSISSTLSSVRFSQQSPRLEVPNCLITRIMAVGKPSFALPVLVLLLAAACLATAQVTSPPKAEVVAELKALKRALRLRPKYALIRRVATEVLSRQDEFPENFDFSDVVNKTLLLPTNGAIVGAGVRKLPTNETDGAQYEDLGLMNVLDGYLTIEDIKAGAILKTMHDDRVLAVKEVRGAVVALGQEGQKRRQWSVVVDANIFKGKFVVAHGVNRMQQP